MSGPSEACCTVPAVVESGYEPKGTIVPSIGFNDLKGYVVGPADAKHIVIVVYDVFGISSQVQQGADLISAHTKARVIIPDLLRGQHLQHDNFPMKTEEEKKAFGEWFKDVAAFDKHVPVCQDLAAQLRAGSSDVKIGIIGLCWGGKVAVICGAEGSKFDAVASVHPGQVEVSDAENLTVPLGFFPSNGEPKDVCDKVNQIASKKPFAAKNRYVYYDTMHHGFAGARAKLSDPENYKMFGHFYSTVSDFFKNAFES